MMLMLIFEQMGRSERITILPKVFQEFLKVQKPRVVLINSLV